MAEMKLAVPFAVVGPFRFCAAAIIENRVVSGYEKDIWAFPGGTRMTTEQLTQWAIESGYGAVTVVEVKQSW